MSKAKQKHKTIQNETQRGKDKDKLITLHTQAVVNPELKMKQQNRSKTREMDESRAV